MAIVSEARRPRSGREIRRRRNGSSSVVMHRRRHGYFPALFSWGGEEYRVQAVERAWTVSHRRRGNRVEGHCFRVRCRQGTFDLFQDARTGAWRMQRQVR